MPLSIKVNLRVTGHCNQGGRKYMEDMFSVAYQQTPDDKDLEYAFFGIFDGHGGGEAAIFAKEHLMDIIVKQKNFWSDKDEDVLRAIRDGYINTHYAMWREIDKWPRTASGLPSTAGTTASIAFIRKGKIYIGHVGDSGIVLGYQEKGDPQWKAKCLTRDHKPESLVEMTRIQESGGKVVSKSGVPRVVWNRPRIGHKGPVRRSTHIDEIPFLAVARSLGDLWSYNSELNTFVVSPEPDVRVITVDVESHRCLIFGTDGLWNMLTPQGAVAIVQDAERHNEKHFIASQQTGNGTDTQMWINPSKSLVDRALDRWSSTRLRADNTSVVTLMLDPPGPSRGEVLLSRKKERVPSPKCIPTSPQLYPTYKEKTDNIHTVHQNVDLPRIVKHNVIAEPKPPVNPGWVVEENKTANNIDVIYDCPIESKANPPIGLHKPVEENIANNNDFISLEKIQVAEVSSSDTLSDKILLPFVNGNDGKPPEDTILQAITRQEAFSGTSDELQSIQRLTRSCAGLPASMLPPLESVLTSTSEPTRRRHGYSLSSSILLHTSRSELKNTKRRPNPNNLSTPVTSTSCTSSEEEKLTSPVESRLNRTYDLASTKRRHSSTFEVPEESECTSQEPSIKRRTRSEDRPCPTDENNPANQGQRRQQQQQTPPPQQQQQQQQASHHNRLYWPVQNTMASRLRNSATPTTSCSTPINNQEKITSPNSFQRRSLEKKATPVKTIRRPSINGSSRIQLRGSFPLRDWDHGKSSSRPSGQPRLNNSVNITSSETMSTTPQRWLRSDTIAATPIKTLRSRNVDIAGHTVPPQIAHQYGIVKQNRLSLSAKIKITNSTKVKSSPLTVNKLKQQSNSNSVGTNATPNSLSASVSGIAKRVKSIPYNPSARSLGTRSRLKRLSK